MKTTYDAVNEFKGEIDTGCTAFVCNQSSVSINGWVNYIHPISERDCHTRKPQPTLTYTQAMVDQGELPSVGMEV